MPAVAFKDLCIDAARPGVVGAFWAELLGLDVVRQDNGDVQLVGATPSETIWVNGVPETQAVKNRVHLDARLPAADTEVPGATLIAPPNDDAPWRVLADPDGAQLCAFGPREGEPLGVVELCVDAADPAAQATWWAERTGGTVRVDEAGWAVIEGVAGLPWRWWVFNPVPEAKTVKNRLHWDVTLQDATVADLVQAGCQVLAVLPGWTVLGDPEGNEFCAF